MTSQFKNLQQLIDFFKDEATCKAYYEQIRWGGNIVCPFCKSEKVYRTDRGFKCANKECHKKFSVTVGTIFENTKISLRVWFAAMFLISTSKKGVSSVQLCTQLGITQKTAWFVLHRIREMLKDTQTQSLSGIIEADETYVGGKNKNRHADKKVNYKAGYQDKIPVVGLLQRGGKVLTFIIPQTNADLVQPIMQEYCDKGSTLITDCNAAYTGLKKDYNHITVKHSSDNQDYRTDHHFHTNNIENFWSIFKRGYIDIYHYMSRQHIHRYCNEFGYRYNTRAQASVERFEDALGKANNARITYNKLIGKEVWQIKDAKKLADNLPTKTGYEHLDDIDLGNV
jgi:transposase-like protein